MKVIALLLPLLFCLLPLAGAWGQDLDTLRARDIETAGYYELRSWAEELDLATSGSRSDLQERIAQHYGVDIDIVEPEPARRSVRIEAAEDLQYFTVSAVEEEHIRLSGGVRIELIDREDESRHRIEADEVVLNQQREILSAYGAVLYEIERADDIERFEGESLTVELESWAGSFLYGTSTRPREVEGETLDFRFSGSAISRSAEDVIVVDDGVITSSVADPPNYRITASRIWVLEPGDWALQNAVLYVGRVPMLYFPYFVHPGRPNVLNFSFGFRDRDGAYVQTTYYIAGRREDDTQPLSVLQLAAADADLDRVREGLFLRPAREGETVTPDENRVRIFADAYSNLGALLALDAEFDEIPLVDDLDLFTGIGATRLQYDTVFGGERRTTYYLDPETGESRQYWSSSQFPGLAAPFRFAADLSTGLSVGALNLSLDVPLYSDPYFERDLLNRFEGIDWGELIGLSDERDQPPGIRSALNWRFRSSFSPSVAPLRPWVNQARLQSANATLRWRRRSVSSEFLEQYEQDALSPPAETFFYPSTLTAPDLSARVAGTLLDSTRQPRIDEDRPARDAGELRKPPPATGGTESTAGTENRTGTDSTNSTEGTGGDVPDDEVVTNDTLDMVEQPGEGIGGSLGLGQFRLPTHRPGEAIGVPDDPVDYRLGYSASPSVSFIARTISEEWERPDDVDWTIAYWEENRRLSSRLNWDSAYLDPLVTLDTDLSVSDRYRNVFAFAGEIDEDTRETLRERAYRGNRTTLDTSTDVGLAPLEQSDFFEGTRINYGIDLRLAERSFRELSNAEPVYDVTPVAWDRDGVRAHNIGTTVAANTWDARQTLRLNYDLPPRQERGTGELRLITGPLESRVRTGYTREDDGEQQGDGEIVYDPLRVTEILTFGPAHNFEQRLEYDLNEEYMDSTRSSLRLGGLRARLDASRSESFEFVREEDDFGWVGQGDERLRPTSLSVSLDTSIEPEPLWRNRIRSDFELSSSLNADLQRFTNSSLDVQAETNLEVFRFLDLTVRARSSNQQMYQYIPGLAEQVGRETRNILVDLARSFNFFSREDREVSAFNIRELEIDAVHDLGDWDLTLRYRGNPAARRRNGVQDRIEWESRLEVSLDWRPIPEMSRSVEIEDGQVDW